MALSIAEAAVITALELLRKQLADNALGVAANTQATEDDMRNRAQAAQQFVGQQAPGDFGQHAGQTSPGAKTGGSPPAANGASPGGAGGVADAKAVAEAKAKAAEKELADYRSDPARREASAQKQLANSQKAERNEKLNANPIFRALSEVASKFAAVAGPAAILGAILNSTVSGFGVLGTSVKVLAGAIAPVLLPATLGLSTIFLGLSEIINEHGDLMERFFERMANFIPVIEFVLNVFDAAADHVQEMADAADRAERAIIDFAVAAYKSIQSLNPMTSEAEDEEFARKQFGKSDSGEETSGEDRTRRGMRDMLQSLRQSIGPRGSVSALEGIGKQVQTSALNADPLETRLLREQLEALNRIERRLPGGRRPARVYDPRSTGAGDYERGADGGAGGDYGGDE